MQKSILIGLGLGLVAAVVFASATTGPLLVRYVLFLITSLPIFLAGLGWGWQSGLVAALTSAGLVLGFAGPLPALAYLLTQALPAATLCYLALLHREVPSATGVEIEWYPPGRLVFWAALMAGLLVLIIFALAGGDLEAAKGELKDYLEKSLKDSLPTAEGGAELTPEQLGALADTVISLMPAATSVSWMSALIFSLYLAGRITLASGQLVRPWPRLDTIAYPRGSSLLLLGALLASAAGGIAGVTGLAFLGSFVLAYTLLGLAVIHCVTRGKPWRPFALWALYLGLLVVNISIALIVALIGILDGPLDFRGLRRGGPQPMPPSPDANRGE